MALRFAIVPMGSSIKKSHCRLLILVVLMFSCNACFRATIDGSNAVIAKLEAARLRCQYGISIIGGGDVCCGLFHHRKM